jgi:hypothetical protein
MKDKLILDWLEEHADSVTIFRDLSKGVRVSLEFCSEVSGCPVTMEGSSVRAVVTEAMRG